MTALPKESPVSDIATFKFARTESEDGYDTTMSQIPLQSQKENQSAHESKYGPGVHENNQYGAPAHGTLQPPALFNQTAVYAPVDAQGYAMTPVGGVTEQYQTMAAAYQNVLPVVSGQFSTGMHLQMFQPHKANDYGTNLPGYMSYQTYQSQTMTGGQAGSCYPEQQYVFDPRGLQQNHPHASAEPAPGIGGDPQSYGSFSANAVRIPHPDDNTYRGRRNFHSQAFQNDTRHHQQNPRHVSEGNKVQGRYIPPNSASFGTNQQHRHISGYQLDAWSGYQETWDIPETNKYTDVQLRDSLVQATNALELSSRGILNRSEFITP